MEFRFDNHVIAVNLPDADTLVAEVRARLGRGEGFALATINLDHLVKLRRSEAFRAAYAAHDLVVADGNPIVWLSRLAGRPVSLLPGSNMVVPLVEVARDVGVGVALVGSTEDSLAAAAAALARRVPGVEIVARIAPPMGFDPAGAGADAVLDQVAASGARLAILALGAPKQESLAARGRVRLPAVGFAGFGAGLDFLAGTQRRAPGWARAIAMEWAWRLLSSPGRMVGRYARSFAILPGQAARALAMRLRRR